MERDTRVTATDDTHPQGQELGVVPTTEAVHALGESTLVPYALDLGVDLCLHLGEEHVATTMGKLLDRRGHRDLGKTSLTLPATTRS